MVSAKPVIRNCRLLARKICCLHDFLHPPLVARGGAQHTSHQMILTISMRKGMKGIVLVNPEIFAGYKYCPARAK